jgi:hypothetical protein
VFVAVDPALPRSVLCLLGIVEKAKLATHATTNVIRLPRNTYHVHAMLVAKNT